VKPDAKLVWTAIAAAALTHFAVVYATPRLLMGAAIERVGGGSFNAWRVAERVTPASRSIVRPAPDFAYSACAYDLSRGPVRIEAAAWEGYWSLSLYAANSDNFFVIDDREVRDGAAILLVRHAGGEDDEAERVVESPSVRGVALIRRLAPTRSAYDAAVRVARADICARAD